MRKLLVKNSFSGVVQALVNLILLFAVIPIFIKMLGIEIYGVFSLIIVVGNLNVFANLGLTSSLIKFLAEQGKNQESDYDIVIAFILIISILFPIILAAIYFNKFILLSILNIPPNLFAEAKEFYIFLLGANFFLISGQISAAVLDSGQKIVTTNFLQILYNFTYWGLVLLVLLLGYNLPQVGMVSFLSAIIWFSLITYQALKYWGKISLSGITKNYTRVAKKQLGYGSKIYASGLIGFFYEPFSKILISHFIGITEVGFFDIAIRMKNQLWRIIAKIFYPLYPLLSSLKEKEKIRLLVHDLEQKTFFFIVPIISIVIFSTYSFIQLWIGQNVEIISISVILIVSAFMIAITVMPNYQFLMAKDQAGKTIILQSSNVFFNSLIFFATLEWLGYYAAVAGNVAAIFISFGLSLYYQKKYLNSLIFDSFEQIGKLVVLAIANIGLGYLLNLFITLDWAKVVFIPLALAICSLFLFRSLNFFSEEDILRYAGSNKRASKLGIKLFCN